MRRYGASGSVEVPRDVGVLGGDGAPGGEVVPGGDRVSGGDVVLGGDGASGGVGVPYGTAVFAMRRPRPRVPDERKRPPGTVVLKLCPDGRV